jgi:hypothetical protein
MEGAEDTAVALRFLAAGRRDPRLREALTGLEPEAGLSEVKRIAGEAGFPVSVEALRLAFRHDWGLRRARFFRD